MHVLLRPLLLVVFSAVCGCTSQAQQGTFIPHNHPLVVHNGRTTLTDSADILQWPGTSEQLSFTGTTIKVRLRDEKRQNRFYLLIDGKVVATIQADTNAQWYSPEQPLPPGRHTAELFKLTEETAGKTWFYGFEVDKKAKLNKIPAPSRRMEFYGNSITAGYSVDDTIGDSGSPLYFNNYYSYAAITARYFKADYRCIAKSGIGIMVSWFPVIMPELWQRQDPTDPLSQHNFAQYTPNIVVVDLGQNDSWLINKPTHTQFKARFGDKKPSDTIFINNYIAFFSSLRKKYPKAHIICTLGSMDATKASSPWPGFIKSAVSHLADDRITSFFFDYKGTPGHPKRKEQQAMAKALIKYIEGNVKW